MASTNPEPVLKSGEDIGLDRTRITADGGVELMADDKNKPLPLVPEYQQAPVLQNLPPQQANALAEHGHEPDEEGKNEKRSVGDKIKEKLHIGSSNRKANRDSTGEMKAPLLADTTDPQPDARYDPSTRNDEEKTSLKHDLLHNPVQTIQNKASGQGSHQVASNMVAKEIPHGQEVEIVRAADRLERSTNDFERLKAMQDINELLKARQEMFVRWTLDRHVQKVRKLPPDTVPWKGKHEFEFLKPDGSKSMDWVGYAEHLAKYNAYKYGGSYIGYTSDPPQPSKDVMLPAVERLLVASAPFQELIMFIRHLYRWEDRALTTKYLIGFLVVWATNMVLPFTLLGMVYLIVHRKVAGPTLADLRKDVQRTEDKSQTARSLSEIIEKEGDDKWGEEIVTTVGPWAMVQLADLANLMEILRNFYEWRVPHRTGETVGAIALLGLITVFVPVSIIIRFAELGAGIAFFGLFPIASRYPDYRILASPVRWLFWKIPTHAEWAVSSLEAKAVAISRPEGLAPQHEKGAQTQNYNAGSNVTGQNVQGRENLKEAPEHDPLGYRGLPTREIDGKAYYIDDTAAPIPRTAPDNRYLDRPGAIPSTNTATTSGADVHGTGVNRQEGGGSHVQNRNERNERGGMTRPDNTQTHPDDERDLGTYTSTWNGTSGVFKICNHGVRFESKGKTHWEVPFERLGRVEKRTRQIKHQLSAHGSPNGQDLRIVASDPASAHERTSDRGVRNIDARNQNVESAGAPRGVGVSQGGEKEFILEGVQARDQAFSQVVGFGGGKGGEWIVVW